MFQCDDGFKVIAALFIGFAVGVVAMYFDGRP